MLDEAVEEKADGEKVRIGTVVCTHTRIVRGWMEVLVGVEMRRGGSGGELCQFGNQANSVGDQVIRGNSVVMLEALERIN